MLSFPSLLRVDRSVSDIQGRGAYSPISGGDGAYRVSTFMNTYLFWGTISSLFFLSAVPAIGHQLWKIQVRKRQRARGELHVEATQSISVNQIFSSYCGVYSFFLFGIVLDSPDVFLTIPRFVALILLYWVVLEIYRERRDRASRWALSVCSVSALLPVALVLFGIRATSQSKALAQGLVLAATVLMAQGCIAQYLMLKRVRHRGAVSLPMHLTLYAKDFSGLMFGVELGVQAWSVMLMHGSNLMMRLPVLYGYLKLPK